MLNTQTLEDLIASHETWLIHRVLGYAKERGYTKHTSTLEAAWQQSIVGLSKALLETLCAHPESLELNPEEDPAHDPSTAFGIREARLHRSRGISLRLFLGLLKYYRQSYIDLVLKAGFPREEEEPSRHIVDRFFDRVELAFCSEWVERSGEELVEELQASNRWMTNEKNRYLTIFESHPHPVIFVDPENRLRDMNHAAALLLFGMDVPGAHYYGEREVELPPWLREVLDQAQDIQHELDTPQGRRTFSITIAELLDVSGQFTGKLVGLDDITDRLRAEEERRQLEQRLQESDRLERLRVMAGGIAHDFNNLLAAVTGYAELGKQLLTPKADVYSFLEQIEKSAWKAARLSQQMLAYSGQSVWVTRPVDVSELVEETLRECRAPAREGDSHPPPQIPPNVAVEFDLARDLPTVSGDRGQLRQVLLNLIENAVEATCGSGEGEGTITLRTGIERVEATAAAPAWGLAEAAGRALMNHGESLTPGTYAYLEVSDTGCGMEELVRDRIFDPFFSTKFPGRGLGLAVVSGIVHSHRGAIRVTSASGRGTTMRVLLPEGE